MAVKMFFCFLFTVFFFQSQSRLSADCPSPVSCSEEWENCDTPEDQMSTAESVVVALFLLACVILYK